MTGSFPNPLLNVSGGDNGASACKAGEAITGFSPLAVLSCAPFGSGNGMVTGVNAGTGLTGGGSSGNVTLALGSSYRLPQSCASGKLAAWSGTNWACVDDLGSSSWQLTGNAGTDSSTNYLGTSDDEPLIVKTNAIQALELQPGGSGGPNLIGGGNTASAGVSGATVLGGGNDQSGNPAPSSVSGDSSTAIGVGTSASGFASLAAGGTTNVTVAPGPQAVGDFSTALGLGTFASGQASTSLGFETTAGGSGALAAGQGTTASDKDSTALGLATTASAQDALAAGEFSEASGLYSTALGNFTTASGLGATSMGDGSTASGRAATALGSSTTASGTGSIAGGLESDAGGNDSTVLGAYGGDGGHSNTFVWSGGASSTSPFSADGDNQFDALATGGFNLQLSAPGDTYTGCKLSSSAGWACTSDRNAKRGFERVDDQALLRALGRMPIDSWSYKIDRKGTRHIGPTAQDFLAAFHVGNNPRAIGTLDEGGVALAADKGLYRLLLKQQRQISALQRELASIKRTRR